MRSFPVLLLFCCFGLTSRSQLKFNIADFNQKFETARWLCDYDMIAWVTSDSVMASPKEEQSKLGSEWLCFKQNDRWHAVYGKFERNNYELVFHYLLDSTGKIKRIYDRVDSSLLNSAARAIINSNKLATAAMDTFKVRCNQYLRFEDDKTISIWLLPAFTTTGVAVYGSDFYYRFDPTGNTLFEKSGYNKGTFKGFKTSPPREIWLDYNEVDAPTLGAVFFVWYYKKYFTKITIETRKSRSTVLYDKDSGYTWIHAEKE
jgi:hypothetical protein